MTAMEMMTEEEKMVVCQDVLGYMNEHNVTLDVAYEEIGVPEELWMTIEEMQDFLYPDGI